LDLNIGRGVLDYVLRKLLTLKIIHNF